MISFLIPFRDADGTRTAAKDWIVARWRSRYPDAEFIFESDDGLDPFNKSMAVNRAFAKSTGDVVVILDADTWVSDGAFTAALQMITSGKAPWVIPAVTSWRLTREASLAVMSRDPSVPMIGPERRDVEQVSGVIGFCHVLPRQAFETVGGMDERFRGWGGEDGAFKMSVDTLWGQHARVRSTLISLWHERPRDDMGRRTWLGQTTRAVNNSLWRRYIRASGREAIMRAVLAEVRGPKWYSDSSRRRQQKMTRALFRGTKYPALMIKLSNGSKVKFVGGRLTVTNENIDPLLDFVASHPEYGIALVHIDAPAPQETIGDAQSDEGGESDETRTLDLGAMSVVDLRAALAGAGQSTKGKKADLVERLMKYVG